MRADGSCAANKERKLKNSLSDGYVVKGRNTDIDLALGRNGKDGKDGKRKQIEFAVKDIVLKEEVEGTVQI